MFWALVKDVTEVFSFRTPDVTDWKDSLRQTQNRWQEDGYTEKRLHIVAAPSKERRNRCDVRKEGSRGSELKTSSNGS